MDVNGKQASVFVDGAKLKHSVHGSMFACVDCHTDVKSLVHDAPPAKVTCGQCHANAQDAYAHSYHAKATKAGGVAANCQDCHGGAHEVLASGNPQSPVYHAIFPPPAGDATGRNS